MDYCSTSASVSDFTSCQQWMNMDKCLMMVIGKKINTPTLNIINSNVYHDNEHTFSITHASVLKDKSVLCGLPTLIMIHHQFELKR